MRLRSSQFVFLLLLVCSVQIGEGCALRLMAEQTLQAAPLHAVAAVSPSRGPEVGQLFERPAAALELSQRGVAAERTAWTMRHPAFASASVASFTGLLRA